MKLEEILIVGIGAVYNFRSLPANVIPVVALGDLVQTLGLAVDVAGHSDLVDAAEAQLQGVEQFDFRLCAVIVSLELSRPF